MFSYYCLPYALNDFSVCISHRPPILTYLTYAFHGNLFDIDLRCNVFDVGLPR